MTTYRPMAAAPRVRPLAVALAWLLAAPALPLAAAETAAAPGQALTDLLAVLDRETEIATRTKMNVDFVPGMVTVLHGRDLLERGARTVAEAMALVPGVEPSMSNDGQNQQLVRGVGKTFSSGKVKALLNGAPFYSTLSAAHLLATIPIEQVERIEVIRGPGSAMYGEFALAGVINVVTRQQDDLVFARHGSIAGDTVGGMISHAPPGGWSVSASVSGTWSDAGEVQAGQDILYGLGQGAVSNAPGPTNEKERGGSVFLRLGYQDFALLAQAVRIDGGDYFGIANALPAPEQRIVREVTLQNIELQQRFGQGGLTPGVIKLGNSRYVLAHQDQHFFPAGFPDPLNWFPNGAVADPYYEENKYYGSAELGYLGFDRHKLLFGLDYANTKQGETWVERNFDPNNNPVTPVPVQRYTGADNWLREGLSRRVVGAYVQDQYSATERLTLTAGVRTDHYRDGDRHMEGTAPRLAAVYRFSDVQTFKVQYAEAFRPPTFLELHLLNNPVAIGNPALKPEEIRSLEFGYIFNDNVRILRATFYTNDLRNPIYIDSVSKEYRNGNPVEVTGVEAEYQQPITSQLRLDANVSAIVHSEAGSEATLYGVARRLANLGLVYRPRADLSLALQWRRVGDRAREALDTRAPLDGYQTVDLTASLLHFAGSNGLTLRAGVKNLFDHEVVYPAAFGTYPGDYPRHGREWWLQLSFGR